MALTRSTIAAAVAGSLLTLGVGAGAVLVGSGAFAESGSPSPSPDQRQGQQQSQPGSPNQQGRSGMPGQRGDGDHRKGRMGHGPGGFGPGMAQGRMLHGEVVAQSPSGSGTVTYVMQQGKVTAVSGSTVSVESTDGFKVTWTVNDTTRFGRGGTLKDIAVGDQVGAMGTKTGDGAATAVRLHERSAKTGQPGAKSGSSSNSSPSDSQPSSSAGA